MWLWTCQLYKYESEGNACKCKGYMCDSVSDIGMKVKEMCESVNNMHMKVKEICEGVSDKNMKAKEMC